MSGNQSGSELDSLVQFRASETTVEFLDDLVDAWGLDSRSDALRITVHMNAGLLAGNFWAVTDPDKLADEWGEVGELLAKSHASAAPMPSSLQEARLLDVIEDIPILLGAAERELGLHPPDADIGSSADELPNVGDRR